MGPVRTSGLDGAVPRQPGGEQRGNGLESEEVGKQGTDRPSHLQQVGCQPIPERQDPLGFDRLPEAVHCS